MSASEHPSDATWMRFLYGEASIDEHPPLENHLSHCEVCRTRVRMWRHSMALLDEDQVVEDPTPVTPLQSSSVAAVRSETTPANAGNRRPGQWVGTAAQAAVLLLAFLTGRYASPTPEQPPAAAANPAAIEAEEISTLIDQAVADRVNQIMTQPDVFRPVIRDESDRMIGATFASMRAADQKKLVAIGNYIDQLTAGQESLRNDMLRMAWQAESRININKQILLRLSQALGGDSRRTSVPGGVTPPVDSNPTPGVTTPEDLDDRI